MSDSLNDKMTCGIVAGVIGAVIQNIFAYLGKLTSLVNVGYLDVVKVLINLYQEYRLTGEQIGK